MDEATYWPLPFVNAVRTNFVPSLVSVTVAFGTTAPAESVTVPTIVPLSACDQARVAKKNRSRAPRKCMPAIIYGRRSFFVSPATGGIHLDQTVHRSSEILFSSWR